MKAWIDHHAGEWKDPGPSPWREAREAVVIREGVRQPSADGPFALGEVRAILQLSDAHVRALRETGHLRAVCNYPCGRAEWQFDRECVVSLRDAIHAARAGRRLRFDKLLAALGPASEEGK